ncbi:hypothetical protein ACQPX6_04105 [Actinomycetospora sp. CA-101289]|uniref:hypothetical protein n=1 Tax=Actinomycetospora sp. CA-101289 TaxID=3239893 RepID=UPI003D99D806
MLVAPMVCPRCRQALAPSWRFCVGCGTGAPPTAPAPTPVARPSSLGWVLGGVGLAVVVVLVLVAAPSVARSSGAGAPSLRACAQHYVDEWGPGLASARGLQMDRAVLALAIVNGSFDAPTDIPRDVLRQAYQGPAPDRWSPPDRLMDAAARDPWFGTCHDQHGASAGRADEVLGQFGCRQIPQRPFRVRCQ